MSVVLGTATKKKHIWLKRMCILDKNSLKEYCGHKRNLGCTLVFLPLDSAVSDVVSLEISVQSDHRWAASKNPTTWSWLEISKHLRIKATTNNTTSARRTKLRRHHNYSKCIASSARTCSHGPCAAYGRRSSHSVPSTAGVTSVIAMSFCVLLYVKCRPCRKRPLST